MHYDILVKRKMVLWKYLSTCILIVITDSKTSNYLRQSIRSTDNDFTDMLHSIIKINEKRVNSLKTLVNLDDYNKAKIALRNQLNIYEGIQKDPEIIGIILGVENTDTSNEDYLLNRRHNGIARRGKRIQALGNYRVETIVKPMSKDTDTSSSEWDCNPNKYNCNGNGNGNGKGKGKGNGNGNGKCKSQCETFCIDSCNEAFKHFCLTYACDYSMKAQMENECNDFCSQSR